MGQMPQESNRENNLFHTQIQERKGKQQSKFCNYRG